jgi:hypothetical protein
LWERTCCGGKRERKRRGEAGKVRWLMQKPTTCKREHVGGKRERDRRREAGKES